MVAAEAGPEVAFAERQAVVEDPGSATRFLLPLQALQATRDACLAAAAARLFVPPGAATVSVLGSGLSAELLLRVVARYVVGATHVAVCPTGGSIEETVTRRVIDELDLSGISLFVTSEIGEAAYGANLVVVAGEYAVDLERDHIAKGALLVNGSGWDLPVSVVDGATRIYVDNLQLLGDNLHRYFVRAHKSWEGGGAMGRRQEHRVQCIAGDLSGVLRGDHVARSEPEGIVLVEALSAGALSTALGHQLTLAAHRLGLGRAIKK